MYCYHDLTPKYLNINLILVNDALMIYSKTLKDITSVSVVVDSQMIRHGGIIG